MMDFSLKDIAKDCLLDSIKEHGVDVIIDSKKNVSNGPKKDKLIELFNKYKDCNACDLAKTRIKPVFGEGDPDAKLMFVGEGPGFEEDRQGLPFVGKAGELLTKIINAINLSREKVYIANVVKCHPMKDPDHPNTRGNDRPPSHEEMQSCIHILEEQIKIIKPKVICALGAVAAKALLNDSRGISKLRGQIFDYNGIILVPTYHPAYLLRNPDDKKPAWEDMKKIRDILAKR
ncbi:MAG: uracil-DNA glycosylase [Elusimicrobiota bacterium]